MLAATLEQVLMELAELRQRIEQLERSPRVVYVPMPVAVAPPAPPPRQPVQCRWCHRLDCMKTHTICATDWSATGLAPGSQSRLALERSVEQTLSNGRVLAVAFQG